MVTTHAKRLHMIGAGVSPDLHFTRLGVEQITAADCVVYYDDPRLVNIFNEVGVKNRVTLDDLYPDGGIDDESYDAVCFRIESLIKKHDYVVFVQQGNPRFGVSLTDMLNDLCAREGFEFDIFPGVSSLDTLMIDTNRDPLEYGSVIVDANRLLLFSHKIQPELDYYIYHVCSIGTRKTNVNDPSIDNSIDLLQEYLLNFYPLDQRCALIESSGGGVKSACFSIEFALKDLAKALTQITFGTTLFIPSTGRPKVNEHMLSILLSS